MIMRATIGPANLRAMTVADLRRAHHAMRRASARGARQRIAAWRRHWLGTSSLISGPLAAAEDFMKSLH